AGARRSHCARSTLSSVEVHNAPQARRHSSLHLPRWRYRLSKSSRGEERGIPVFPNRFESPTPKSLGHFRGGPFITDIELARGQNIFPSLVLGDYAPAHGAMERAHALARIATRFRMTAGAHHGDTKRSQNVAQSSPFPRAQDNSHLRKSDPQRTNQSGEFAICYRESRLKFAGGRT